VIVLPEVLKLFAVEQLTAQVLVMGLKKTEKAFSHD